MNIKKLFMIVFACSIATAAADVSYAEESDQKPTEKTAPTVQQKPGSALTFEVGTGEVTLYGEANISVDYVDNGLSNRAGAVGKNGGIDQISSNQSYFGVRGSRPLNDYFKGVFQLETEPAYTSTPGPGSDAQVKSGLGSRDSFVGLQGFWGGLKVGKEDAPYKRSTARMDPFAKSLGDYNSIIGNSGGDNRAEFDTRVPHAVWYESPNIMGLNASVLMSPGQNRMGDNSIPARLEPTCTGGNNGPPCTDGSFGRLWSTAITYTGGPLYALAAYELHQRVNRTGDEGGASNGDPPAGSVGVADESALKGGLQLHIDATSTIVNLIYEKLKRNAPDNAFNERTRNTATWVAITQKVTTEDELNFGWAHAGKTPGDPGGSINVPGTPLQQVAGPINNQANMYSVGYIHRFDDKKTSLYLVGSEMKNQKGAHYDLGASGHGAVVDCKDGSGACFTGTTIKAVSVGMVYDF
ncbi:MAG: porin [Nitrospirae bacterium]|nr:porin [Nitrospirota bacterium]